MGGIPQGAHLRADDLDGFHDIRFVLRADLADVGFMERLRLDARFAHRKLRLSGDPPRDPP